MSTISGGRATGMITVGEAPACYRTETRVLPGRGIALGGGHRLLEIRTVHKLPGHFANLVRHLLLAFCVPRARPISNRARSVIMDPIEATAR